MSRRCGTFAVPSFAGGVGGSKTAVHPPRPATHRTITRRPATVSIIPGAGLLAAFGGSCPVAGATSDNRGRPPPPVWLKRGWVTMRTVEPGDHDHDHRGTETEHGEHVEYNYDVLVLTEKGAEVAAEAALLVELEKVGGG